MSNLPQTASAFPATRWSLVLSTKENDTAAMEELCRLYWQPLFSFARGSGLSVEDAEDVTQRFFHDLIEDRGRILEGTNREDGRLRTWFRRILQRRIVDHFRHLGREKRGGGNVVSLEAEVATTKLQIASPEQGQEAAFDQQWALSVIQLALSRLNKDFSATGREAHFHALAPFLSLSEDGPSYTTLQQTLQITESASRQMVHRFRERFRRHLREEIAETLQQPTEQAIDRELEDLKAALAARSGC